MTFDATAALYVAPLIGALFAGMALWARSARVSRAGAWSGPLRERAAATGRWGWIGLGLTGFAAAVALSGPRWGARTVTAESKSLNLVIAIDVSRSMLAEDVRPSRLERAKQEATRLIHDLESDRIGLVAFAGQSFIMSPLTVDGSALQLLLGSLDPDIASAGGTELSRALRQGRELLLAGSPVADRVLIVFTDGESHDSLPVVLEEAQAVRRDGIRLIMAAEGGAEPVRIPLRSANGNLEGYHTDASDRVVLTARDDNLLTSVSDAAQASLIAAELGDQAGAIRSIVRGLKRAPQATSTTSRHISRAWIPLLLALAVLAMHSVTRTTAALAVLTLMIFPAVAEAQGLPKAGDEAWRAREFRRAAELYLEEVRSGRGGDTAWLNVGTAALAIEDTALARRALARAAQSLEPEVRYRALFNLGLLNLRLADWDSRNASEHLAEARRRYREALLLRPGDRDAKWNLELAIRREPPSSGGEQEQQDNQGDSERPEVRSQTAGLSQSQAEQVLNSIAEEERRTRERLGRRRPRNTRRGVKDW